MKRGPSTRLRTGFTLVELAVVLSLMAVAVPAVFHFHRAFDAGHREALARLDAARGMRSFSEELRRDLRSATLDAQSVVLVGPPPCERVEYAVDDAGVLSRRAGEACGGPRPVAMGVGKLERRPWGVTVTFARRTGRADPFLTRFDLALPAAPPPAAPESSE